jgi:hypothetical protein
MRIFCEVRTDSLCIIWISVFQSGFREGVPGVPRKSDECLGILYVVFLIFIDLYLNVINYEYEVTLKKKDITCWQEIFQKETGW